MKLTVYDEESGVPGPAILGVKLFGVWALGWGWATGKGWLFGWATGKAWLFGWATGNGIGCGGSISWASGPDLIGNCCIGWE